MTDVQKLLRECFRTTFPGVPASSLETLAPDRDAAWDSLATLTLVMLVEERFDIRIPTKEIPHLMSFQAMAEYLERSRAA